ncbi:hypothetical protein BDN72DRAFT_965883 [Pluteus cervinus]|uniref:Uncharacterized protein n=1 Tax=Pluteus cervinus TaxID=181527 RepID=A0ACD3A3Z2_9AGAR|nr:hypothetical protein BDN72DRAFT_965883 [Pluteus cervinus]
MLSYFPWALQRARTIAQALFLRFGLHCATHQIRVILISCVVITSLFYPALALYASSQPKAISLLNTFIPPNTLSGAQAQSDLVNVWSIHKALRVHEDAVSRAKCSVGRALRVERVLIQSPMVEDDDDGALNHRILSSTLQLEKSLEALSLSQSCLRRPDGKCLVLSPLLFWNHDSEALTSDSNILDTLSLSSNVTVAGVPITPHMVLAGRGSADHVSATNFDYAMFLSLTYFFPQSDCIGKAEHLAWLQAVQRAAASHSLLTFQDEEPTLIALEYDPELSKRDGWSAISTFIYIAYIGFFAYVTWSMRHMDKVHSRVGLTFTALVEIAVSTITSLSVCALVGFKITMVPWELLPIVIVFVGAENMFNLVYAVSKTHVTLSVKQRIAEGLSVAGTSNTFKVVSYNCILGVIAVFSVGAIRQFCAFAIVVLVAHWFLAHTFFLAVLSIDLQRLELDELLRHASLAPAVPQFNDSTKQKPPKSGWRRLVKTTQNILRSRATTNISLLMLLAITATLYYATYTASTSERPNPKPLPTSFGAVSRPRSNATQTINQLRPIAEQVWETLNPNLSPLLHVRLETPSIITFNLDNSETDNLLKEQRANYRAMMRTLRIVLWLLKIMVLPIVATTFALWLLCLYLVKDVDLLEAQKNKPDENSPPLAMDTQTGAVEGSSGLEDKIGFGTLPRAFRSDIELMATSRDGNVVVSVGLRNEVGVWRVDGKGFVSIDAYAAAASSSSSMSTVTAVALDDKGRHCAVGTRTGVITIWRLDWEGAGTAHPIPLHRLELANSSAAVTDMQFVPASLPCPAPAPQAVERVRTPPQSEPNSPARERVNRGSRHNSKTSADIKSQHLTLLTTYESGVVAKWPVRIGRIMEVPANPVPVFVTPFTKPLNDGVMVLKVIILKVQDGDGRLLVGFCMDDGSVQVVDPLREHFVPVPSPPSSSSPSKTSIPTSTTASLSTFEPIIPNEYLIRPGNPVNTITKIHVSQVQFGASVVGPPATSTNSPVISSSLVPPPLAPSTSNRSTPRKRLVIATSTETGAISVWDGLSAECITALEEDETLQLAGYGSGRRVNRVRVTGVKCDVCRTCGDTPREGLVLAAEVELDSSGPSSQSATEASTSRVEKVVRFWRLWMEDGRRKCECKWRISRAMPTAGLISTPANGLAVASGREGSGRRSRSNSTAGSPLMPRARLFSNGNGNATSSTGSNSFESPTSAFPVSAHGVHSRRASEKERESGRRSLEALTLSTPFSGSEDGGNGTLDMTSGGGSGSPSIWKKAMLSYVTEVVVDRGGWDVSVKSIVGVRKRGRVNALSSKMANSSSKSATTVQAQGLTPATLERWEVWSFDPSSASLQCSALSTFGGRGAKPKSKGDVKSKFLRNPDAGGEEERPPSRISTSSSSSSSRSRTSLESNSTMAAMNLSIPRLPFTRVSPFLAIPSLSPALPFSPPSSTSTPPHLHSTSTASRVLAGFGNTIGVFEVDDL